MGCSSCGGAKAIKASQNTGPWEVTLPDGTKVTVKSMREQQQEIDAAHVRMRAAARAKGYSTRR